MSQVSNIGLVYGVTDTVAKDTVLSTMSDLRTRTTDFTNHFRSTINSLMAASAPITLPDAPSITVPTPDLTVDTSDYELEGITQISLDVSVESVPEPSSNLNLPAVPAIDTRAEPNLLAIESFTVPEMVVPAAPVRDTIDTSLVLPDEPDFTIPPMEALTIITVPAFTPPTLPTYSDTAPVFTATTPTGAPVWAEPTYATEVIDEVIPTVRRMMQGELGLPPAIQDMLFERARSREDRTAAKAVGEAFDTFAARGFSTPPGMLVQQVNIALEQNQLQANALQREVMVKVADVAVENMRAAVQQGLAAEQILVNIHQNAAQRAFDMARYTVEASISLYNAQANIFNANTQAFATRAQVYKTQIDAELAQLEVQRFALEQAKLTGEINQQRVAAFTARVQALGAQADAYRTQVQARTSKIDIAKAQIEAYHSDVEAYAALLSAKKAVYDAYSSRADVERSKAQVNVAKSEVFKNLLTQDQMKLEVWKTQSDAEVKRIQLEHDNYAAHISAFKEEVGAKMALVQRDAEQNKLVISAYSEKQRAQIAHKESAIRIAETQRQALLAQADVNMKAYETTTNHLLAQRDIQSKSLQAAGQMAATLAGGAMAAQNVQASVSFSEGHNKSLSNSLSDSRNSSWSFNAATRSDMPL
jgi:hypothetical protein